MRRVFWLEGDVFGRLKRLYYAVPSRRARRAPVAFNARKTLIQSFFMGMTFLIIGSLCACLLETMLHFGGWPLPGFRFPFAPALILFVAGFFIAHWSAWVLVFYGEGTPLPLDATHHLVVKGPYRWVRNPMACASLTQGAAIGLLLGSPLVLLYVLCGAFLWNVLARPWEEADMEARFGEEFCAYRRAVHCWRPRFAPYSSRFHFTEGQNVDNATNQ